MEFLGSPSCPSEAEWAWCAALLEGEGTFGDGFGDGTRYVTLTVAMTDEDVIARFAKLTGSWTTSKLPSGSLGLKRQYVAGLGGEQALYVMTAILPWMGKRRTERICQIMGDYAESRMHVCVECDREFFHKSVRKTVCSRRCEQDRTNACGRRHYAARKAL